MNYGIIASADEWLTGSAPAINTYAANAVHFAGGPNLSGTPGTGPTYLSIASLTATDNGVYSFSLWANDLCISGNYGAEWCVTAPSGLYAPEFKVNNSNELQINFMGPTGTTNFGGRWSQLSAGWHHLLGSVQTNLAAGNKIFALYVDDVLQTPIQKWDTNASFIQESNGNRFDFGDDGAGYGPVCDFADVWFAPGVSLLTGSTIAEADRRLFIDGSGKPVDPVNFPSGAVLFTGDNTAFATNQGTGGSASLTGSLTNASTHP